MKKYLPFLTAVLLLLLTVTAFAQPQIPPTPTSSIYAQDYAGVLKNETKEQINTISSALAARTKAQVVVVTVNTLEGYPIEDYALGILRNWGVGDRQLNNGVVMLVAVGDRKSRIEIGYGLEGALNDAKTGTIQDSYMLPYFQKGDYDSGILQGYLALVQEVAKEYNLDLQTKPVAAPQEQQQSDLSPWTLLLIIGVFALDWIFLGGRITALLILLFRNGGRGGGGGFGGGGGYGGGSGGGGGSSRSW